MKRTFGLLAVLVAMGSQAVAQDPSIEICRAVFDAGTRNTYSVYRDSTKFDFYRNRLCRYSFESLGGFETSVRSSRLNLATAKGVLGLRGDRQRQNTEFRQRYDSFCQSTLSDYRERNRFVERVSQVETALADSFNRCVRDFMDTNSLCIST